MDGTLILIVYVLNTTRLIKSVIERVRGFGVPKSHLLVLVNLLFIYWLVILLIILSWIVKVCWGWCHPVILFLCCLFHLNNKF